MELFQELKDLNLKQRKASYRKDWDSVNKLKQIRTIRRIRLNEKRAKNL